MDQYLARKAISARKQRQLDDQRRLMNEAVDHELQAHYALFRHDFYAMRKARNVISKIQEPQQHLISSFVDTHWDFAPRLPYRVEYLRVAVTPCHDDITSCTLSEPLIRTAQVVKNRDINNQVVRTTLSRNDQIHFATISQVDECFFEEAKSTKPRRFRAVGVREGTMLDHANAGQSEILAQAQTPDDRLGCLNNLGVSVPSNSNEQDVDYFKRAHFGNTRVNGNQWTTNIHHVSAIPLIHLFQTALLRSKLMCGYYLWLNIEVIFHQTVEVLFDLGSM